MTGPVLLGGMKALLLAVLCGCASGGLQLRAELLSVHNMEPGDSCPRWSDLKQIERLECDVVPGLVALLADKTLLEGYTNLGAGVTVGAMAFIALGEIDPLLWREVAYAQEPASGVFSFLSTMRESPETIRDAVLRRGVMCRPGGLKARAFDKMCPETDR